MICFLLFVYLAGVSLGLEVRQSSSEIITKPGDKVEVFCSHNKTDYRTMLWYQRSPGDTAMKLIGYLNYKNVQMEEPYSKDFTISGDLGGNTAKNGSLTVELAEHKHSAVYYCAASQAEGKYSGGSEAFFGGGTKLIVLDPDRPVTPPKVKILQPSQQECRNQKEKQRKKTLVCVASGFYPDHVTVSWKINDEDYSSGVATDSAAQEIEGSYRITSRFKVNAALWENQENSFMCIVSFFDGETTTNHTATLHGVQGKGGGITRGEYLKVTQSAKLSYVVVIVKSCIYGVFVGFLVWKLQGSSRKHK